MTTTNPTPPEGWTRIEGSDTDLKRDGWTIRLGGGAWSLMDPHGTTWFADRRSRPKAWPHLASLAPFRNEEPDHLATIAANTGRIADALERLADFADATVMDTGWPAVHIRRD